MPKVARKPRHRTNALGGGALHEVVESRGAQQQRCGQHHRVQGAFEPDASSASPALDSAIGKRDASTGNDVSMSESSRSKSVPATMPQESIRGGTPLTSTGGAGIGAVVAAAALPTTAPVTAATATTGVLSRGQKKRQAKKMQYLRREQLVLSSLRLRREQDQKNRIDGLDALRNALLDAAAAATATDTTVSDAKKRAARSQSQLRTVASRQRLVQREAAQMSLVMQHPAFREDPFGAIEQHLRNTTANGGDSCRQRTQSSKGSSSSAGAEPSGAKPVPHRAGRRRKHHRVRATRTKSR